MTARDLDRLPARIRAKITIDPLTGCWVWTGARTTKSRREQRVQRREYGSFRVGKTTHLTHRLIPALLGADVGREQHHTCPDTLCCRPDHLAPKDTPAEHKIEHRAVVCSRGHEMSAENTGIVHRSSGRVTRYCKACQRQRRGAGALQV